LNDNRRVVVVCRGDNLSGYRVIEWVGVDLIVVRDWHCVSAAVVVASVVTPHARRGGDVGWMQMRMSF